MSPGVRRTDLVLSCAGSGAVIAVSAAAGARPEWARGLVFLASGETYAAPGRGFEFARYDAGGHRHVRYAAPAALFTGPAEVAEGTAPAAGSRVPVCLDVTLEPVSMPVGLDAPGPVHARGFRTSGSLAVGSVIHRIAGQAWWSESAVEEDATGVRVTAAFQDGSGLLATDTSAALLVHTRTSVLPVEGPHLAGPGNGPPAGLRCTLAGRHPVEVTGKPRHPGQYAAFVRPSGMLTGCTPIDVVRSGITGFGLVERVTPVTAAAPRPARADDLPDPF